MKFPILFAAIASSCTGCFQYSPSYYGNIDFVDRHGIHVAQNGFPIDQAEFEGEIERVWELWHNAFYHEGIDCYPNLDGTYVSWQGMPFVVNSNLYLGMMEDFGTFGSHEIVIRVAWTERMENTALGHELGHAFLDLCELDFWENDLYWWTAKYGLPY